MKKVIFMIAVALVALTACQKQAQVVEKVYSVDEVFAQGESMINDTIIVEGNCIHLCKHGGKKAFLSGSEEGQFIRANAVDFEAFAPECVNNTVKIKGVLRAIEVPAEPVVEAEEHHHEDGEACSVCSTVKRFYVDAVEYSIVEE